MRKTSLVLLFSAVVGVPLAGGLVAAGEGPWLDNSRKVPSWEYPARRLAAPDGGAGGAGGVPDGGAATTNAGGPRRDATR
jgi:hypothetical protein